MEDYGVETAQGLVRLPAGLLYRHPDSAGSHDVILIAHDERLDEPPLFVPLLLQISCPVLRASTSLHADQTGFPVAEERKKIQTPQLFIDHFNLKMDSTAISTAVHNNNTL